MDTTSTFILYSFICHLQSFFISLLSFLFYLEKV